MLSYQHIYHAGNLADVHKHTLLAWMLSYLTRKDKPLSYIETHAGRALYDLDDPAALKTGEAARGIGRKLELSPPDHPYSDVLDQVRRAHGVQAYPGSPYIAASLLRPDDRLHLAELHKGEHAALELSMSPFRAKCYNRDGFELAHSLCPPDPRRGMLLIDPSYEIKTDYEDIPNHINKIARAWNVGVICLWYPLMKVSAHHRMLQRLKNAHTDGFCHEVAIPPARDGHGMIGSGLFVINPPYGLAKEAARVGEAFKAL